MSEETNFLDLESLDKVSTRLAEALAALDKDPNNLFILDSVIKRFELTYELSIRNLRRFLLDSVISDPDVEDLSFQGIIRMGARERLLQAGWPEWKDLRMQETRPFTATMSQRPGWWSKEREPFCLKRSSCCSNSRRGAHPVAERGVLDLNQNDLTLVRSILQRYVPHESVYVFGSRATGRTRYLSDLDLLLDRQEPLDRKIMRELIEAFDESDLPIEVDVVDLATVTDTFRTRVMTERIPFPMTSGRESIESEVHA